MKKTLILIVGIAVALLATGCATRTIEAASTQISIASPMGKTVTASLPKEIDATDLALTVDPATGVITLKAAKLRSSSQGVISQSTESQAQAIDKLADTLKTVAPLLAPAAK